VIILGTWEAAYRIIHWSFWRFPAPSHIIDSLLGMLNIHTAFGDALSDHWPLVASHASVLQSFGSIFTSQLIVAVLVSSIRLLIGFVISVLLGSTLGVLMWRSKWLDELLGPLFLGVQTLPSVCWIPLGMLTFGLSEMTVQFVLVMGSTFSVAISLRDGMRTIPPLYQRAGKMLGASGWRLYRYVLFPASLPALASGLRQGFSFAWRSLMGAEFVLLWVNWHGLGYALDAARNFGGPADVMAIMIVMVVLGMLADRLAFAKLEARVYRRFGLTATR
jgi:NitT/TauT family transport system permease protein